MVMETYPYKELNSTNSGWFYLGKFENYNFWGGLDRDTMLIDDKNSKVDRRYLDEWYEKNIVRNCMEMSKKWMVKIGHPM